MSQAELSGAVHGPVGEECSKEAKWGLQGLCRSRGSEEEGRVTVRTTAAGGEAVFQGPGGQGRELSGQSLPHSVPASAIQPTSLPFPGRCPASLSPTPTPEGLRRSDRRPQGMVGSMELENVARQGLVKVRYRFLTLCRPSRTSLLARVSPSAAT